MGYIYRFLHDGFEQINDNDIPDWLDKVSHRWFVKHVNGGTYQKLFYSNDYIYKVKYIQISVFLSEGGYRPGYAIKYYRKKKDEAFNYVIGNYIQMLSAAIIGGYIAGLHDITTFGIIIFTAILFVFIMGSYIERFKT